MSNGAGKGSVYRPVDRKKYDENYERIFGPPKKEQPNHRDECIFGKTCLLVCTKECLIGEVLENTNEDDVYSSKNADRC